MSLDNILIESPGTLPASPERSPFDHAAAGEIRRLLTAHGLLTPSERQVIALHFELGLKFAEISRKIGLEASRVRQLVQAALTKLRTALKQPAA